MIAKLECKNGEPDLSSEIANLILHGWQAVSFSESNRLQCYLPGMLYLVEEFLLLLEAMRSTNESLSNGTVSLRMLEWQAINYCECIECIILVGGFQFKYIKTHFSLMAYHTWAWKCLYSCNMLTFTQSETFNRDCKF